MACEQYGTALLCVLAATYLINYNIQCPLDIATLDIAAALPIATSSPVTDVSRSMQCALYFLCSTPTGLCSYLKILHLNWCYIVFELLLFFTSI